MNDRQFIELLNLYVDNEIGPEDALRLEAEVLTHPERREVYRQYCRMQKACSMLSERFVDGAGAAMAAPEPARWGFSPVLAGLAAACLIVVVGLRFRAPAPAASPEPARHAAPSFAALPAPSTEPMEPVFFTRAASSRGIDGPAFAVADAPQAAPLIWIADVHLSPVVPSANPEFLLTPRTDLKATMLGDIQTAQATEQASEMTAFRFQR